MGGKCNSFVENRMLSKALQTLNTLLRTWKQDVSTKVLIFTKSVKLLDMLDFYLSDNGKLYYFAVDDGR